MEGKFPQTMCACIYWNDPVDCSTDGQVAGAAGRRPVGQAKPGHIYHHILNENTVITDLCNYQHHKDDVCCCSSIECLVDPVYWCNRVSAP